MTFLELCVQLREEAGMSGSGPTSVVGQSGEMKRVVTWVKNAWLKIQNKRTSWRWMKAGLSVEITAAAALSEVVIPRFARWVPDSVWIYEVEQGENNRSPLFPVSFQDFRDMYLIGAPSPSRPVHVAVSPGDSLLVGPEPQGNFRVVAEYYRSAQMLAANNDVPEMPERFHEAIVWRAMMEAGGYDSAAEVYTRAARNFKEMMNDLESDQLDKPRIAMVTLVE